MQEYTINRDETIPGSGASALLANRYRVVRQLGAGGMGSVWLAEDTQLDGKLFALKMLPSILVSNKRAYKQLKDEALVAMKLVHPNIVQIRAFEENNGNPFLVMDYIDGETLDDWLGNGEQGTGKREEEVVRLLRPIAEALDYAHTEGVVHRDVKPANVMIRKDGRPFIMDFGIAREIQETMTRVTGKLSSGTLLYMSPEQLNGEAPKPAQDVYSFAAMVYECLKGEPPFCRGAIEDQIKNKSPEALPDGVSVSASILRGLAKKPESRPKNCAGVLAKGCSEGGALSGGERRADRPTRVYVPPRPRIPVSGGSSRYAAVPPSPRISASGIPRAAVVAVLLLLGLVVGSVWYRQSSSVRPAPLPPPEPPVVEPPPTPTGPCESDVTEIAVEAAVQKEKIEHIDGGDGFASKKYALFELLTKATAYGKAKSWAKAALNFTNYVEDCKALVKLDSERRTAKIKREEAAVVRKRAEAENAAKYASERWTAVRNVMDEAAGQFSRMNFTESRRLYDAAVMHFGKCITEARTERARQERLELERIAEAKKERARQERLEQERIAKAQKERARRAKWRREGETYTIDSEWLDLTMKWCPAGAFMMGSPVSEEGRSADEVQHCVNLSNGFWLGETEVTQGQWKKLMGGERVVDLVRKGLYDDALCCRSGNKMVALREYWGKDRNSDPLDRCGDEKDNVPIYNLTWHEATEFCKRLTEIEGKTGLIPDGYAYRLPTEAEWEYACRAGVTAALPNGKSFYALGTYNSPVLDDISWYAGNSSVNFSDVRGVDTTQWKDMQYPGGRAFVREVRGKAANRWGFYDMIGNVWEWCYDYYSAYGNDVSDPIGASKSEFRIVRGGAWDSPPGRCRAASRACEHSSHRAYNIGFRVALAPVHPGMTYPEAPVITVPKEDGKEKNFRLAKEALDLKVVMPQNRQDQGLVDRPYDLQFCRHCRMRLSHLKQVPKNCPQCGRNLFGR